MHLSSKVIVRGLIAALLVIIVCLLLVVNNLQEVLVALMPGVAFMPTAGPLPPPPTITAPRGELPSGHVGLEEWALFTDGSADVIGSGFLLLIPGGQALGVTSAHSLYYSGALGGGIDHLAFRLPGASEEAVQFETYYGHPGRVFSGYDFHLDYALLQPASPVPDELVLGPDPRGVPQVGERVVMYSGLGNGQGNPRLLRGTVTSSGGTAVWVQMDEFFDASKMSGSPLLSEHTGLVLAMAISAGHSSPLMIGFNPISAVLERAREADQLPDIRDYKP